MDKVKFIKDVEVPNIDITGELSVNGTPVTLQGAMKFLGTSSTAISDGSTTNKITVGGVSITVSAGNVVLYNDYEYVWTGSAWEELGHEGSFKVKQSPVTSPAASGSTTAFIDTITQDTNGKITATKKHITEGSTSAKGIVQLTDSTSSTSTTTAATPKSVKTAYDLASDAYDVASDAVSFYPVATQTESAGNSSRYAKICTIKTSYTYQDIAFKFSIVGRSQKYQQVTVQLQTSSSPAVLTNQRILVSGHGGNVYNVQGYIFNKGTYDKEYVEIWCSLPSWDSLKFFRELWSVNSESDTQLSWNLTEHTALPTTSSTTVKITAEPEAWQGTANRANQDGNGNIITSTYATKNEVATYSKIGHTHSVTTQNAAPHTHTHSVTVSGTTGGNSGSAVTVATGSVTSTGNGSTVVTGASGTATVLTGVIASDTDTFLKSINGGSGSLTSDTTSTNGIEYISSASHTAASLGNPSTSSAAPGNHTHTVTVSSTTGNNSGATVTAVSASVSNGVLTLTNVSAAPSEHTHSVTVSGTTGGNSGTNFYAVTGYPYFSGGSGSHTTKYLHHTHTGASGNATGTAVTSVGANGTATAVTGLSTGKLVTTTAAPNGHTHSYGSSTALTTGNNSGSAVAAVTEVKASTN